MRLWQYQRNQFNSQKIGGTRRHNWREAAIVAVLLGGAAVASGLRPASPLACADSQVQRADMIDDIIDCIDAILGGGGGSGSGSGSGSGGGGSTGSGGNP